MALQRRTLLLVSLSLFLIPAASRAQQTVFEAAPGVTSLAACDYLHNKLTCDSFHLENVAVVSVGTKVKLGGTYYLVEWMGSGYYLESGLVLQLLGETSAELRNQRWLEVSPKPGRIHISSSWQDGDRDRHLSVADSLTLEDGRPMKIRDVRLLVRASPAPPQ